MNRVQIKKNCGKIGKKLWKCYKIFQKNRRKNCGKIEGNFGNNCITMKKKFCKNCEKKKIENLHII